MSVKISSNKDDELNVIFIKRGHPLKTLQSVNSEDDVLYLHVSKDILKEIIWRSQEALKDNEDFQILFTGDIKFRHNFQIMPG
jgi:hypothetical protein